VRHFCGQEDMAFLVSEQANAKHNKEAQQRSVRDGAIAIAYVFPYLINDIEIRLANRDQIMYHFQMIFHSCPMQWSVSILFTKQYKSRYTAFTSDTTRTLSRLLILALVELIKNCTVSK
jgi:hypothetical protein